jgi:hypothetical protein
MFVLKHLFLFLICDCLRYSLVADRNLVALKCTKSIFPYLLFHKQVPVNKVVVLGGTESITRGSCEQSCGTWGYWEHHKRFLWTKLWYLGVLRASPEVPVNKVVVLGGTESITRGSCEQSGGAWGYWEHHKRFLWTKWWYLGVLGASQEVPVNKVLVLGGTESITSRFLWTKWWYLGVLTASQAGSCEKRGGTWGYREYLERLSNVSLLESECPMDVVRCLVG